MEEIFNPPVYTQKWEKNLGHICIIITLDFTLAKKVNLEEFVSAFLNFVLFFSWVLVVSQSDE